MVSKSSNRRVQSKKKLLIHHGWLILTIRQTVKMMMIDSSFVVGLLYSLWVLDRIIVFDEIEVMVLIMMILVLIMVNCLWNHVKWMMKRILEEGQGCCCWWWWLGGRRRGTHNFVFVPFSNNFVVSSSSSLFESSTGVVHVPRMLDRST